MPEEKKDYWKKSFTELKKGWQQVAEKTTELAKQVQSGEAWEITKKRLAETVEFIGKQAKAGSQLGKLKLQELMLIHQRNSLLNEIGQKTVRLHKRGEITDPGLKEACKKLSPVENQLAQLRRAIRDLSKKEKSS